MQRDLKCVMTTHGRKRLTYISPIGERGDFHKLSGSGIKNIPEDYSQEMSVTTDGRSYWDV